MQNPPSPSALEPLSFSVDRWIRTGIEGVKAEDLALSIAGELAVRERLFNRARNFIAFKTNDAMVVGVPNATAKATDYYVSVGRSAFMTAGRLTASTSENARHDYIRRSVAVARTATLEHAQNAETREISEIDFDWRIGGMVTGDGSKGTVNEEARRQARLALQSARLALERNATHRLQTETLPFLRRRMKKGKELEAQVAAARNAARDPVEKACARLQANLPTLVSALRRRLRAPELEVIGQIAAYLHPGAVKAMRSNHMISNRLYGWLAGADHAVANQRRQALALNYPVLLPYAYAYRETKVGVTRLIDGGMPLDTPRGNQAFAAAISVRADSAVSGDTLSALAALRPLRDGVSYCRQARSSLRYLNAIPSAQWPPNHNTLLCMDAVFTALGDAGEAARSRLVTETSGNWQGFIAETGMVTPSRLKVAASRVPAYAENILTRVIETDEFAETGMRPLRNAREQGEAIGKLLAGAPYTELLAASVTWEKGMAGGALSQAIEALDRDGRFRQRVPNQWLPLIEAMAIPPQTRFMGQSLGEVRLDELTSDAAIAASPAVDAASAMAIGNKCLTAIHGDRQTTTHAIRVRTGKTDGADRTEEIVLVTAIADSDRRPVYLIGDVIGTTARMRNRATAAGQWLIAGLMANRIQPASGASERIARLQIMHETRHERLVGADLGTQENRQKYYGVWKDYLPRPWQRFATGIELNMHLHAFRQQQPEQQPVSLLGPRLKLVTGHEP